MELVRAWATATGCAADAATVPPFRGGIDWRTAPPSAYTHVIFVSGPSTRGDEMELAFLKRIETCRMLGVNLSMLVPINEWNPLSTLLERDSSRTVRPDITLASPLAPVPLIGRCVIDPYEGASVDEANQLIQRLVDTRAAAIIEIDTRLDHNVTGFRTAGEVESVIARMDLVLTTRLHGMVLALKHGDPAIALDPEPAVGKIPRQAAVLGWPFAFAVDTVTVDQLAATFDACRRSAASDLARACGRDAHPAIEDVRRAVVQGLAS